MIAEETLSIVAAPAVWEYFVRFLWLTICQFQYFLLLALMAVHVD